MANKLIQLKDGNDNVFAQNFMTVLYSSDDLNNCVNTGVYYWIGNANTPQHSPQQFQAMVEVTSVGNGTIVFQRYTDYQNFSYIRRKYASTWTEWSKLSN